MERIQTILVPTDFSVHAARALSWAIRLARGLDARIHLLHVMSYIEDDAWGPLRYSPEEHVLREEPEQIITSLLDRAIAEQGATGLQIRPVVKRGGGAASGVTAYARSERVDLVVMGTHGRRGLRRLLLGSVAEEVAQTLPCPVLLVRDGAEVPDSVERILAPVDFTPAGRSALPLARTLAAAFEARLTLLHVLEDLPPEDLYEAFLHEEGRAWQTLMDRAGEETRALVEDLAASGARVTPAIEMGYPPSVIAGFAREQDVDLIVMPSSGPGGPVRSVVARSAEQVVREAPRPVLVVKVLAPPPVERPAVQRPAHAGPG